MSAWLTALSQRRQATRHVDSAFIMGDVSPQMQAQYQRIATLVRQGRAITIVGSGIVLVALIIATGRGAVGLGSWLLLPGVLVLALLFRAADRLLTDHPPGAQEVPADLAQKLLVLEELRDDIIEDSFNVLPSIQYDGHVAAAQDRVAAAIATATLVLDAERAGDDEVSARLRAEIEDIAGELRKARDSLVSRDDDEPVPGPLGAGGATTDPTAAEAPRIPNATHTDGSG